MEATAWHGGTYGIRVGKANAQRYFPRHFQSVDVELDGAVHTFRLSHTFWTTCPEFRGKVIEQWLNRRGLIPWPKGRPPVVRIEPLGDKRFRLCL